MANQIKWWKELSTGNYLVEIFIITIVVHFISHFTSTKYLLRNKTEILIVNEKLFLCNQAMLLVLVLFVYFFLAEFKSLESLGCQGIPENTIIVTSVRATVF